jgi:NADPH:quinone reductase-like Zn-dependent oxidoreductase
MLNKLHTFNLSHGGGLWSYLTGEIRQRFAVLTTVSNKRGNKIRTVKAARIHHYDGAEAVRVEDASLPGPQAGELLICIHAAGVNPIDWKIRAGFLQQMMPQPLPFTLGGDFSGAVEAVGPGVRGFKVGDEVYGLASAFNRGSGSFAEFGLAWAGAVAPKPQSMSHVEAGGLPIAGVSALHALTKLLRVSAGQKVLIHGGAGGIGSIAIQLAKHLGAYVATTASADDIDYVKGLGADEIIDYRSRQFEEVVVGLDAGIDTVGCDTYVHSFRVLKRGVRLVSVLEQPRQEMTNHFEVEAFALSTQVTTERLTELAEMVDKGALKVHVDKTFPLEQAGAALDYMERESFRGKVVLKIV